MDEDLRNRSGLNRKAKNVIHRTTKTWNERIQEQLNKESKVDEMISSEPKKSGRK
jgi:hypothetical protein